MTARARHLLAGAIACLAAQGCGAKDDTDNPKTTVEKTVEFTIPLARKQYAGPKDLLYSVANVDILVGGMDWLSGYTLPPSQNKRIAVEIMHMGGPPAGQGDAFFGYIEGVGKDKALWIDWNKDNKFEPEERAKALEATDSQAVFKIAGVKTAAGPRDMIVSSGVNGETAQWADYLAGTVEINKMPTEIRLYDAVGDGKFAARQPPTGRDLIAIDYNQDGIIQTGHRLPASTAVNLNLDPTSEVQTFHSVMQMPDGRYYFLQPSADLSHLTLTLDHGQTGTIDLDADLVGLAHVAHGTDDEPMVVVDKQWRLPTGTYRLEQAVVRQTDATGHPWLLTLTDGSVNGTIQVGASDNPPFESKPPYTLSCGAQLDKKGGRVVVTIALWDASRHLINLVRHADGTPAPLPEVSVQDESGKTVAKLQPTFWQGQIVATWRPPTGAKGAFSGTATWTCPLWGKLTGSQTLHL